MVVHMVSSARPYAEVIEVARPIVERIVWCTVTTVGPDGSPRSRLMHPVWFWDGDETSALVTARPTPIKVAHLAAQPAVSCFYWDPTHDSVAIDATATWLDRSEYDTAWRRIAALEPPVGFDPAIVWPDGPDSPDCGFLRFQPRRIVATPAGQAGSRWTR